MYGVKKSIIGRRIYDKRQLLLNCWLLRRRSCSKHLPRIKVASAAACWHLCLRPGRGVAHTSLVVPKSRVVYGVFANSGHNDSRRMLDNDMLAR